MSEHPERSTTAAGPATTVPAVELSGITKSFPGVVANRDIDITVARGTRARDRRRERRGQVHAHEDPLRHAAARRGHDRGRRRAGRLPLAGRRDQAGHRHGAPALQAGRQPHGPRERRARRASPGAGWRLDLDGRPDARSARSPTGTASTSTPTPLVEDLGVGERQRVEILKVLYRGARTLILDEPTAVLVPQEVDELFDALRELKAEGLTIIFISHKLDEVLKVADEITVIRRGHDRRAPCCPTRGDLRASSPSSWSAASCRRRRRASRRSPTAPCSTSRA